MAVGGEIKTVLSLDVSKFTSNLDRAANDLSKFDKSLNNAAKVADGFEKSVKGIAGDSAAIAGKFKLLDQTISAFVDKLAKTAEKLSGIGTATSKVKKAADDLKDGLTPVQRSLSTLSKETDTFRVAMESLKPSLQRAVQGHKDLTKAQDDTAASAKKSAADAIRAKLAALESEKQINAQTIAEKEKLVRRLAQVESEIRNQALGRRVRADQIEARLGSFGGKNQIASELAEATRLDSNAGWIKAQAQAVLQNTHALEARNEEIARGIVMLRKEAAAEQEAAAQRRAAMEESIRLTKAEKDAKEAAESAARQKARESVRAEREAAAERKRIAKETADYERQQAESVAQMWRSMGQLWAASKVEKGIKASVSETARGQRAELQLKALNLPTEQFVEFKEKAFNLAKENKYLSFVDSLSARLVGLTSIGGNHVDILDKTVGRAVTSAQALKAAGYEHDDLNNVISNLYGVTETRQQTADAEAMKRTFDLVTKIGLASRGKLTIADLETVLRNMGQGANTISDTGLLRVMGMMEQQKVAGHSSAGSSGAGVSSVGTMVKMSQLYAQGKPVSDNLLEQLVGADIMGDIQDKETLKGGVAEHKAFMRAMKSSGFKDSAEVMSDPFGALWKMRDSILKYMSGGAENRALYFGDANANIEDEKAQRDAINKFWARSGLSNKAVTQNSFAMDPRYHKRSEDMAEMAKNSLNGEQLLDAAGPNWDQAVARLKKGASDLTSAFDPFVKQLSKVVSWIGEFLSKAGELARENPIAASMNLTALAIAGVAIGIKGFTGMFGIVGSLSGALKALAGGARTAAVETTAAGAAAQAAGAQAAGSGGMWGALTNHVSGHFTAVGGMWKDYLTTVRANVQAGTVAAQSGSAGIGRAFGALGSGVMNTAKFIGKAFLRMIPLVGELLIAWDLAELLSHLKVGGHEISEWMGKWLDDMLTGAEVFWNKFLAFFESGTDKAARLAKAAQLEQEQLRRQQANGFNVKTPEQIDAELKARSSAMKALDRINSPNFDPVTGKPWEDAKVSKPPAAPPKPTIKTDKFESRNVNPDYKLPTAARLPREFEDLFNKTFQDIAARAKETQLKLDAIEKGEPTYAQQAEALVFGKWAGGQFDKGKDPQNRGEFLKDGVRYNTADEKYYRGKTEVSAEEAVDWDKKGKNGKSLRDMQKEEEALIRKNDLLKALTFSNERYAAMEEEADVAAERLTDGLGKETDAMRALRREFKREEARNPEAKAQADDASSEYAIRKNKALFDRARADLDNYGADLAQKNKEAQAKFLTDPNGRVIEDRERLAKEFDATTEVEQKKFEAHRNSLNKQLKIEEDAGRQDGEIYLKAVKERELAENNFTEYLRNRQKEREEALMKPIEKMALEWKKVYGQIEQMEARWADSFLDNLHATLTGGRVDWRSFLLGMLSDVSKMMLKKAIGDQVKDAFGGLGDWLKGALGAQKQGAGAAAGQAGAGMFDGIGNWLKGAFDKAVDGIKGFWNSITGASDATAQLTGATGETVVKQAAEALGITTKMTAEQTATTSLVALASAAEAAATALGSMGGMSGMGGASLLPGIGGNSQAGMLDNQWNWMDDVASFFGFANGGIMTEFGPVALRQYANGGIANSPQLAMFGEGSMPEAYVPLPDGRSIPVTISGGGGQVVNISIVVSQNNKGGDSESKSSSGEDAGMWSRVADRVKSVVREEMVSQQRPGGLLYK